MARWTHICRFEDIPCPGARIVPRENAPDVAVFRTADDRLFALLDRCPHRGAPLSKGVIYGETVACPLHQTNVELASGNAVAPDKGCVQVFAVKVEKGIVYVDLRPDERRGCDTRSWGSGRVPRLQSNGNGNGSRL